VLALVVLAGVLGLAVGSFLNVVIYRVPRGESVVKPSSHCPGCDRPIAPYDNIPVVSWLILRGRCRQCGTRISLRYPAVELLTALLFAAVTARLINGQPWAVPAFLYVAGVGVALGAIDLDVRRLPDVLTLPSYVVTGGLLLLPTIADGRWSTYGRAWLAGLALLAFYFVLAVIKPGAMGMGDVKLAGVLGLTMGWLSWRVLLVGGFLGFVLGGLVGGALMVAGRAGRKSHVPFGPFMLAGALIAVLSGQQIADWYVGLVG
jgi:leader peptidase (prepilin peptidase) / N-methyltransferase